MKPIQQEMHRNPPSLPCQPEDAIAEKLLWFSCQASGSGLCPVVKLHPAQSGDMLTGNQHYNATQDVWKEEEKHHKWERRQLQGLLWESQMENDLGVSRLSQGPFCY